MHMHIHMYVHMHMCRHVCRGQKLTYKIFPSCSSTLIFSLNWKLIDMARLAGQCATRDYFPNFMVTVHASIPGVLYGYQGPKLKSSRLQGKHFATRAMFPVPVLHFLICGCFTNPNSYSTHLTIYGMSQTIWSQYCLLIIPQTLVQSLPLLISYI